MKSNYGNGSFLRKVSFGLTALLTLAGCGQRVAQVPNELPSADALESPQLMAQASQVHQVPTVLQREWKDFEPGDLNQDRRVNVTDQIILIGILNGSVTPTPYQLYAADLSEKLENGQRVVQIDDYWALVTKTNQTNLRITREKPFVQPAAVSANDVDPAIILAGNAGYGSVIVDVQASDPWIKVTEVPTYAVTTHAYEVTTNAPEGTKGFITVKYANGQQRRVEVVALAPVTPPPPVFSNGTAQVTIRDGVSLNRLSGASFLFCTATHQCQTVSATEQTQGTYTFNLPAGQYDYLEVAVDGYRGLLVDDVVIEAGQHTVLEQLRLVSETDDRQSVVKGQIVGAGTNAPLAGADFTIRRGFNNSTGYTVLSGVSDNLGQFEINLPSGYYTISTDSDGYEPALSNFIVTGKEEESIGQMSLAQTVGDDQQIRIIPDWNKDVYNLDAHLTGLGDFNNPFHLFYAKRSITQNSIQAELSDNTEDPRLPEMVTIAKPSKNTMLYSVHGNSFQAVYGPKDFLSSTNLRLRVYQGNTLYKTVYIPDGIGNLWDAIEITAKETGELKVDSRNKFSTSDNPSDVLNISPIISVFTISPRVIDVNQPVTFKWTAVDQNNANKDPLTCEIEFGDGAKEVVPNCHTYSDASRATHTYTQADTYTVTLTATDVRGTATKRSQTITVGTP